MSAIVLTLALAIGTSPDDDAAAALALAQAAQEKIHAAPQETYCEVQARAVSNRVRLVVFVGAKARNIAGCETYAASGFAAYPAQCIIVSNVDGSWRNTLASTATDSQIVNCEQGRAVQPIVADPFDSSSSRGKQAPADVKRTTAGPQYNASHRCPTCGATVTAISGRGPGGTHTHQCPRDGTVWFH